MAWQESGADGQWRKRVGRCREGCDDDRAATAVAAVAVAVAATELHTLELVAHTVPNHVTSPGEGFIDIAGWSTSSPVSWSGWLATLCFQ
jgi:hypothetical protein